MLKKYLGAIILTIFGIFACIYRILECDNGILDFITIGSYFLFVWMVEIIPLFKMPKLFKNLYFFFIFFFLLGGSVLSLYDKISFWDVIAHTVWGYIGGYLGILLYWKISKYEIDWKFLCVFCFVTSLSCAALWEIFEFLSDRMFDSNVQHWEDSGVFDTMYDIICNFIGAIVFVIHYIIDVIFGKNRFFGKYINKEIKNGKM